MTALGFALSLLLFLCGPVSADTAGWKIALRPSVLFQGGVAEVQVEGEVQKLKGTLGRREILFFASRGVFAALLGVDLDEPPGAAKLVLEGWNTSGRSRRQEVALWVRKKEFPQENISVPALFDHIDEATKKRIESEQERLNQIWAAFTPQRWWEGAFVAPVPGAVSSPFGLRRIVNGLPRAPHGGVDLRAALGAEVLAANHGRVVLVEEFFFSGKSLVLDHGAGLYTMYFHLDEFLVGKGTQVRKGDLIGRAGMTGRVTGPHLHWGARLNGARVDPLELLQATGGG